MWLYGALTASNWINCNRIGLTVDGNGAAGNGRSPSSPKHRYHPRGAGGPATRHTLYNRPDFNGISAGQGDIITPVYDGQRGDPVLISRRFFHELLELPFGSAPRDLLRCHPDAIHLVEIADDSVLIDLDDLETYQRWQPH